MRWPLDDRRGRAEQSVLDYEDRLFRSHGSMEEDTVVARRDRERAARRELRVGGSCQAHGAAPGRTEDVRPRLDAQDLYRAGSAGRRDRRRLEPALRPFDHRPRERVVDEPGRVRLVVQEIEPEGRTLGIGQRRTVRAHGSLVERIADERRHRRELHPPVDRVGDAEGEPPTVRRERARDDAVADVERLIWPAVIERLGAWRQSAAPVSASIQRALDSSNARRTSSSGFARTSIGACTLIGVFPTSAVTSAWSPSGSTTLIRAGTP